MNCDDVIDSLEWAATPAEFFEATDGLQLVGLQLEETKKNTTTAKDDKTACCRSGRLLRRHYGLELES